MTDDQFWLAAWWLTVVILVVGGIAWCELRDWWRARR